MRFGTVAVVVLAWSVWGCGSDKKEPPAGTAGQPGGVTSGAGGAGPGGASAAAGTGPGAGGAAMTGPAITSAPAAWSRPADCQGVGEGCPGGIFDCTGKSVCQTEGYVCIPAGADTGLVLQPRTAERPYCLAYQCMTYEEASCFCTGKVAAQYPLCSSPAAVAGLCKGAGASCVKDKCCDGLTCVKQSNTVSTCQKTCSQNSECDTGCCTDPNDSGQTVCAAATACQNPCKKRGASCVQGTDRCCTGTCVMSDNTDFSGCRATCATSADCDTGCCQLFANSSRGFCADAKYCTCGAQGATCGPMQATCCDGLVCSSFDNGPSNCNKKCVVGSDCPSGCCPLFAGQTYGVCAADPC